MSGVKGGLTKWKKTSCRVSNIKNSFIKRLFEMATDRKRKEYYISVVKEVREYVAPTTWPGSSHGHARVEWALVHKHLTVIRPMLTSIT